jgi:hypothetical protein
MERRFEFQDLAALGAIGVGVAIGIKNAKSAGVTTDDIVRAYSNTSPIRDATPIPLLQKTQMSQRDILGRIAKAVQVREDFNSKKLNAIISGMATERLTSNELNATKFGLLEYATSPQVDPQVRTQFLGGDDIGEFAAKIFNMDEPQVRSQVSRAASISTLSEQRRNLGNIIGTKSRSASRFKRDLNKVARVFDVKQAREKTKLPVGRPKRIFKSMTANQSYSAVLGKNVNRYPLRDKILTLSSDFSQTFKFKGGAEDSYKQIENALEGLDFKNSINDSLRQEIIEKFRQSEKHIGSLKARGIIPNTGNLSFTVMGMKGMDQPAIYLNVPFGDTVDETRGRVGFQIPLNRPNYISSRGTSTPVYFSTNQPRNPVALNAMTMRAANVSEMGELQGGSRLVSTIDAVFFGGSDDVPIEKIPFYEAILSSKSALLPLDDEDPVLNRLAAQQKGVAVQDVSQRLRQGNISTVNPLDSLFGTGDDKAKYGQSVIGTIDDAAKSQLMVQRGRMIGVTGLSDLVDGSQFTSKDIFSDIHSQLNNTIQNYGGRYSILRVNAASVSPGQVGIEKGGVSAVSFDLTNPEALGLSQEQLKEIIEGEGSKLKNVRGLTKSEKENMAKTLGVTEAEVEDILKTEKEDMAKAFGVSQEELERIARTEGGGLSRANELIKVKIGQLGEDATGIMDEYTHFGLLQGTSDPSGFNQGRRPSQPLVDVFTPTASSVENLRKSDYVFEGEDGKKISFFSPLDEIGVSNQEMPSQIRRTRINRRYLFMHPDVEEDILGGAAARVKSSLQEGLSVAITDTVNPEFYGQSVKSRVFLGDSKTVLSERMEKLTEALLSLPEEARQDSTVRKELIKKTLYEGDPTIQAYPKPVFTRGEFLGLKMDARTGLDFSAVDFGGMPEYVLEDAYIDGGNLDLEFKPIIRSQQASKVMLSSKTTQLAMDSNEFMDAMRITGQDEQLTSLFSRGRIDAVANASEIARVGNLNAIRSQQASALSEIVVDKLQASKNVTQTRRGLKGKGVAISESAQRGKGALVSLNMAMTGGTSSDGKGYRYSNFNANVEKAREILRQRKSNFGQDKSLEPVITALEDMLNKPKATSSLLEIVATFGKLTKGGQAASTEDVFGVFGLEKVKAKDGSLIAGLRAVQEKGKYHAGILGVMSDKGARDLTLEVLGELTKDTAGGRLLEEGFLENTLERIGAGLSEANVNTSFIRGQAATTFRTTAGIFEANQVSMERRAIHSILNVNQFVSEDGRINFRDLFLEDLASQIQGPSKEEAILAGSLLGNNGLLDLARGDKPIEVLTSATEVEAQGRVVALPFLQGHVKDPTLYMPSTEQAQILQRNIVIGEQVLDRSYMGKIDEIKKIVGGMTPEDIASFDPKSTGGQSLINAFNEARVVGYSTATDINERFFSGAIIGSVYTLQQSAYKHFEDNLRIADNVILKTSTKGGGLVTMVNRREAERLIQGARRVAPNVADDLTRELLENRTSVLEISTRSPTISGTPRIAGLVQYDPDLDYEASEKGNYFKSEVDGKTKYIDIDDFDDSVEVTKNQKGEKIRYREVNTEVRRQGYAVAEVTEGGKTREVKISSYSLSGTTSDDDGDLASRNLYVGGNRQEVQEFLTSEDGRRQMLGYIYNQTSMQIKYEDMVKASPRMEGFEAAAKGSGEVLDGSVRALSQHAGQAEIGRVSSGITQLKLLANYGKEAMTQSLESNPAAIKGIEESYERFMAFTQALEQVPISFKHSAAGETPSAKLTSEIMSIFSNTDQVEAEKAMNEFLMSWMGGDRDEVARISSEWMDNFMKTAVSYSVASEDIRAAIQLSTKHSEDVAKMTPEEFQKLYGMAMSHRGISIVTATHSHAELQQAAIKGNEEIAALNNSMIDRANEVDNKIKANIAQQKTSAVLNEKGKAFSKIAKPVGAGLVAAGLIYAMFDQGRSADNLEEPGGREGLRPPAGIRMNNPQRDTNLNVPYEDREMNYAPNTIDRRTVGSSNTGRINSRAQVSQNVNALEVARAMQTTIPHAQIGVNVQYSNKMNPRLEQDL